MIDFMMFMTRRMLKMNEVNEMLYGKEEKEEEKNKETEKEEGEKENESDLSIL